MHHMACGVPHCVLRDLAKKYGPLMHLQLGEVSAVVVTSSETAKQVLKTHDLAFASMPLWLTSDNFYPTVNFTKRIIWFTSSMPCRSAFGQVLKEQDMFIKLMIEVLRLEGGSDVADVFPSNKFLHVFSGAKKKLLDAHHKDMFTAGTETSSTIIWAMVEMLKNPRIFTKAQAEVRDAFRDKVTFNINDVEELKYLKSFIPERFEQCSVDFLGNNFEYLPFGDGRKICPGISFGLANVYLPLAKLLYHFDWKLPTGIEPRDLDLTELDGIVVGRKSDFYLIATPYQP
ncbi:5-epiaristolochene 1,3-dihydroxylase [Capsicum baccatum]|uniref:5-epiaristolochene 1,3-dihydroxylase n=1 Tax=Capsicum baccatum TaxID=33114 RepID=A0A2G2VF59_CAPBA|nr:5-epiaristolochene 1,3-dihydroxylase [Capsicum baccatum]